MYYKFIDDEIGRVIGCSYSKTLPIKDTLIVFLDNHEVKYKVVDIITYYSKDAENKIEYSILDRVVLVEKVIDDSKI